MFVIGMGSKMSRVLNAFHFDVVKALHLSSGVYHNNYENDEKSCCVLIIYGLLFSRTSTVENLSCYISVVSDIAQSKPQYANPILEEAQAARNTS